MHIGAPKTGTTYLQDRLALNARTLARHDVHLPSRSPLVSPALFHFRAALDLLGEDWGGHEGHAAGNWQAMVKRVRRASGTVIFSHEILAPAEPEHIARLRRDLDGCEIHIVYSARDLARQAPAGWQESIKQGRRWSYRRYLSRVTTGRPWFARAFDLPTVLSHWSVGLSPDRVHVVTVPQADATEGDLLWERFCQAFVIDPAWAPLESDRSNASLGSAETQVLRRLNQRISREIRRDAMYDDLILGMLAADTLAGEPVAARSCCLRSCTTGPTSAARPGSSGSRRVASTWSATSTTSCRHHRPRTSDTPTACRPRPQLEAALDALAAMTREAASRPDPETTVRGRLRRVREVRRR